jgi:hypothetical protein
MIVVNSAFACGVVDLYRVVKSAQRQGKNKIDNKPFHPLYINYRPPSTRPHAVLHGARSYADQIDKTIPIDSHTPRSAAPLSRYLPIYAFVPGLDFPIFAFFFFFWSDQLDSRISLGFWFLGSCTKQLSSPSKFCFRRSSWMLTLGCSLLYPA